MNENRRQILEMLAAGKITADEAERLLAALDPDQHPKPETGTINIVRLGRHHGADNVDHLAGLLRTAVDLAASRLRSAAVLRSKKVGGSI